MSTIRFGLNQNQQHRLTEHTGVFGLENEVMRALSLSDTAQGLGLRTETSLFSLYFSQADDFFNGQAATPKTDLADAVRSSVSKSVEAQNAQQSDVLKRDELMKASAKLLAFSRMISGQAVTLSEEAFTHFLEAVDSLKAGLKITIPEMLLPKPQA